jgi:hypothetical protein
MKSGVDPSNAYFKTNQNFTLPGTELSALLKVNRIGAQKAKRKTPPLGRGFR